MIKVEVTQPSSIGSYKNTNTTTINFNKKKKRKKSKNFIDLLNMQEEVKDNKKISKKIN